MTQEEAVVEAKENLFVAEHFKSQADDILSSAIRLGTITKEQVEEVKHLLSCASAHTGSAIDYLLGEFTTS